MKNKGCLIAGCAGTAIIGVVIFVIAAAGGFYVWNQGQAKQERREYQEPATPGGEHPFPVGATLSNDQKVEMVALTLAGFQAGVRAGTFRGFYDAYFSDLWKKQISPEQLDKAFGVFLSSRIDINPDAFRQTPVFTRDDKDGYQYKFAGYYTVRGPQGASKVTWEFDYIIESSRGWGLTRVKIFTAPQ